MPIIGQISVGDGATFTPAVSSTGELSWSNNKNLPNPATLDIPQVVMDRYQIAPIASPAFTGNPTAPTQAKTDNSTKLATTAYVKAVAADYLALTGGSITGDVDITGDLSVSGAITGNLTGSVTGNVTGTASGNLALTGGTMTGVIKNDNVLVISNESDSSRLVLASGNSTASGDSVSYDGAAISLAGKNYNSPGVFALRADDGTNSKLFLGYPNGALTWDNKAMERIHGIDIDDDMSTTPANAYIKYESGLLICFGNVGSVKTTNTWVTFPSAFSTKPRVLAGCYSSSTHVGWSGTSTTGVNFNSTSSSGISVGWIAIGTWK